MAKYRELFNIEMGKKLKSRRIEMGFRSQAKFAEAIGVSRNAVALWETGVNGIDDENYPEIKKVLKVGDSFFDSNDDAEVENLKIMNRLLMDQVKALEAQLNGQPLGPGPRDKNNKPLKRR